jgi:hypothetical protein
MIFKKSAGCLSLMLTLMSTGVMADDVVNARYETVQCALPCQPDAAKHLQWWLMRDTDQVEIRNLYQNGEPAHHSGLWLKKPAGQFNYVYLMHDERRAIDYADVDLKLLSIKTDDQFWQVKSQLVTDSELASLQKVATESGTQYGYPVEKFVGSLGDGIHSEIWWIPALKLPFKVAYTYPQHTVTIQLQSLQPAFKSERPVEVAPGTSLTALSNYQHVDYTDLGDMEHNPSDMQWLAKAHGAPGLQAHSH